MSVEIIAALIIAIGAVVAALIQARSEAKAPPTPLWRLLLGVFIPAAIVYKLVSDDLASLAPLAGFFPDHIMTIVTITGVVALLLFLVALFNAMRVLVRLLKIIITT